jgi:hypothetical protein
MYKLGWKVVSGSSEDGYRSCTADMIGTVVYRFDKWTKPKKGSGPLLVFKIEGAAMRFGFACKIFPCLYVPSKVNKMWYPNGVNQARKCEIPGKASASKVMLLENNVD